MAEGVLDARYLNSKGFKVVSVAAADLSHAQVKLLEGLGTKEVLLAFDIGRSRAGGYG